jgi:hypothetical protein
MTPEERQQLKELMDWKEQKTRQQISFPLDVNSDDVIRNRGYLVFNDKSTSTVTADKSIGVRINGVKYYINVL